MSNFDRSGRTSPSTREAIAGMLSISRMCMGGSGESGSSISSSSRSKKKKHKLPVEDVEDIEKVHQDDDFSKSFSCILEIKYKFQIKEPVNLKCKS